MLQTFTPKFTPKLNSATHVDKQPGELLRANRCYLQEFQYIYPRQSLLSARVPIYLPPPIVVICIGLNIFIPVRSTEVGRVFSIG